jgi:hypothetical protein
VATTAKQATTWVMENVLCKDDLSIPQGIFIFWRLPSSNALLDPFSQSRSAQDIPGTFQKVPVLTSDGDLGPARL